MFREGNTRDSHLHVGYTTLKHMETNTTISGQILQLHECGYSPREVWLELKQRPGLGKVTLDRVQKVIRQSTQRVLDSQRLFDVWECVQEILAIVREMQTDRQRQSTASRMRSIERKLMDGGLTGPAHTHN